MRLGERCQPCRRRGASSRPAVPAQGLVSAADIDAAAGRVLAAKFRLGVFDPPAQVPFSAIGTDVIGSDAHRALALEAAQKSARSRPPPAARRHRPTASPQPQSRPHAARRVMLSEMRCATPLFALQCPGKRRMPAPQRPPSIRRQPARPPPPARRAGIVLLKNRDVGGGARRLPLSAGALKKLVVMGPHAKPRRCCWATTTACPRGASRRRSRRSRRVPAVRAPRRRQGGRARIGSVQPCAHCRRPGRRAGQPRARQRLRCLRRRRPEAGSAAHATARPAAHVTAAAPK